MEKLAVQKASWLSWFFRGVLILGLAFLVTRLIELQVIKGNYFRALAEGNRIRRVPITAARGKILARGGEVLVGNKEVKKEVTFAPESGYKKVEPNKDSNPQDIIKEWQREYYLGAQAAHITGYLGEVNEDEVGKVDGSCNQKGPRTLGLFVGRSGLEAQYDCTLRGIDGEELVEVDTAGRKVRVIGTKEPVAGQDITTTIDINLQRKLAETIGDSRSAAVITDTNGQILAMYSGPSFDPTNITPYLSNEGLPLFNRVLGGAYHPGSVFKIVTATAALEDGAIDKNYTYEDTGVVTIKADPQAQIVQDYTYTNWYFTQYGRTEGVIDLPRAIARSTDTFFYKLGESVGVDNLVSWAQKFGLDSPTGIDLPGEVTGLVPNPKWKKRVKGERWFLGNTYHMAIGQGDLALTPIAVNRVTTAIANGGKLCKPHLVGDDSCQNLGISPDTINEIKEGMVGACTSGGTAFPFFDFADKVGFPAACKTGTAETFKEDITHAWFTVMAPADFPELVMTVMLEEGGEGSSEAAPLARQVFDYYFNP